MSFARCPQRCVTCMVIVYVFFLSAGFAPRPTRLDFDMPPLHTTSIALQNDNDKSSSSSSSAAAAPATTAQGHHPSPAYHHSSHHRPSSYSPTKGPAPPIPHHGQHGPHGGPPMQPGDYDPWANATSLSPQMPSPMMHPPKPTPRTSTLQHQQQQQQSHGSSSIDVNKNSSNNNFSVTSPAAPEHQYNNNNSNNTSRVMVNQPGQHMQQQQQQMQMPPVAAQAEPVYELEKKGHTSVIRVSYPLPSEPSVTFPTLPPSAAQDTPPIPPARRNAGNVPAATLAGATAMPPQLAKFPTLQIRSDSQMGLDNFKFCTVLGRGHFGKVRWTDNGGRQVPISHSTIDYKYITICML